MANRSLTMKGKKQVASVGVVAVVLLLAKFFPTVYGRILAQTATLTKTDGARASEILNGIILVSLGAVWFMLARLFSYAPFFKNAWSLSGVALFGIGVLLLSGQNPFNSDEFDPSNYGA